jgi:hypothetical protein
MADCLANLNDLYNLRLILEIEREAVRELEDYYIDFFPLPPRVRRRLQRALPLARTELFLPSIRELSNPSDLSSLANYFEPDEYLQVCRVQYASPGSIDLAGLGAVVGHVKDLLVRLIELASERKKHELENESIELDNQKKRIENARLLVQLAKDIGYTDAEMRILTASVDNRQKPLLDLVEAQQILSAKLLEGSDNES